MKDDRAARYTRVFHRHHAAVHRYVQRRTSPDSVEDVVSETFLVAWRRFDDIPGDGLPWLFAIAARCLANHRRGALRGSALVTRLIAEQPPFAHDDHGERQRQVALIQAFASLGDADRELLSLIYWDGLSSGRAARVLGISAAAGHARAYRARKRLRETLAAELGTPGRQLGGNAHEAA